jgi:hypothetical protein
LVGQPQGALIGQARVVLLQPGLHAVHAGKGAQRTRVAQVVEPARHAAGRFRSLGPRQAETFQVDQAADAGRLHAGVVHHDVAAHAVAQQVHRRLAVQAQGLAAEQGVQVGQVVGEPVGVRGRPAGAAKAPPVHGQDVAVLALVVGHRIHQELEGGADVHEAMAQQQRRALGRHQAGVTPLADVVLQAADVHPAVAGGAAGLVHGRGLGAAAALGSAGVMRQM